MKGNSSEPKPSITGEQQLNYGVEINHADHNYHPEYWFYVSPTLSTEKKSNEAFFLTLHKFDMDLVGFIFLLLLQSDVIGFLIPVTAANVQFFPTISTTML